MIPDYHLHSSFSGDAETDINIMIKSAISKGMTSFCITDHYDKDYPVHPGEEDLSFDLDIDTYLNHMKMVRDKNLPSFDLRIGMEMGVMDTTADYLSKRISKYKDFDFIIMSSHVVDGEDPYYPAFYEGKDEKEVHRKYFESILNNVKAVKCYSVYGHLDYCLRYGKNKADNFDIKDHYELFEEIFKTIIYDGKGIELNTGSLYRGLDYAHPHIDILKLYKSLGGEILTFGSDSHEDTHIGYNFENAAEYVKSLGFKAYCSYKNMKPDFHDL